MALTGELSDLSLAELIEFFCNQRKTGRLKLIFSVGPGYFYLQSGSVVHARIGSLRGIDAVYFALTLPNASFTFSPAFEAPEQTINQPWTSVVLEGLRRMDEGIQPQQPVFGYDQLAEHEQLSTMDGRAVDSPAIKANKTDDLLTEILSPPEVAAMEMFLSQSEPPSHWLRRPWTLGAVAAAIVLIVAVIGVPRGWYARGKAPKVTNEVNAAPAQDMQVSAPATVANQADDASLASQPVANSDAEVAARKQREERAKERARALEAANVLAVKAAPKDSPTAVSAIAPKGLSSPANGPRKVTVQVTYDENGRVTQASGGDPTALRIARQKRFPAGKAGSATITIPIN